MPPAQISYLCLRLTLPSLGLWSAGKRLYQQRERIFLQWTKPLRLRFHQKMRSEEDDEENRHENQVESEKEGMLPLVKSIANLLVDLPFPTDQLTLVQYTEKELSVRNHFPMSGSEQAGDHLPARGRDGQWPLALWPMLRQGCAQ